MSNQLDRIVDNGLAQLKDHLIKKGLGEKEAKDVCAMVKSLNFPGLVTFMATSRNAQSALKTEILSEVAKRIADQDAVRGLGLDRDAVARALEAIFIQQTPVTYILRDPQVRELVMNLAVKELASGRGVTLTPEQIKKVVELIETGEFLDDFAYSVAAILHALRDLPPSLAQDLLRNPLDKGFLAGAVATDLVEFLDQVPAVVTTVFEKKRLNPSPAVLKHTMKWIYSFQTTATVARTIHTLLANENETLRLAIVVYARANGFPLEEKHLDLLRDNVFNTTSPDLGPIFVEAYDELTEKNSDVLIKRVLRQMRI